MHIAVIGGGVFGAMTAIRLADAGRDVTLFERLPMLLGGASGIANRLHMGFHYPRDDVTARQCLRGYDRFRREFADAIVGGVRNAYFIASQGSATTPDDYLAFCDRMGLAYRNLDVSAFRPVVEKVDLGIMTDEAVFDPRALRRIMGDRLERAGAKLRLGSEVISVANAQGGGFELRTRNAETFCFDQVVNCCYANANDLSKGIAPRRESRQYEFTVVPVIDLGSRDFISISVFDGPFFTLLPYGTDGRHLLFHVEHSVIKRDDGAWLNQAWLNHETSPLNTIDTGEWFARLLAASCEFVPALAKARVADVLQSPRMVLLNHEHDDRRTSSISEPVEGFIEVFSGKVDHCVWIADEIVERLSS